MNLVILDTLFSVVKLSPSEKIPAWACNGDFFSITGTKEELSIVCPSSHVPHDTVGRVERDWKCIKVEGVLDFALTGILTSLANPLAQNDISIFAISTYNTDYLLIKADHLQKAKLVLEHAGHIFREGITK